MRLRSILVVGLVAVWTSSCRAEEASLQGVVVTPEGKPAARAEVFLVDRIWLAEKHELLASTIADEQGQFAFQNIDLPDAKQSTWRVVGWLQEYAIGWDGPLNSGTAKSGDLKIKLGKAAVFRGQLSDSSGKPLAGIPVRLRGVSVPSGPRGRRWDSLQIPPALAEKWATRTDAKGAFTLTGGGEGTTVEASTAAPTFGEVYFYWGETNETLKAILRRRSSIQGRIQCPEPQLKLNELTVKHEVKSTPGQATGESQGVYHGYHAYKTVPVDEEGRFQIEDVVPGAVRVHLVAVPGSSWQPEGELRFTLREGEKKANVVLVAKPRRGTRVSGRVVDAASGQPLPDVILRGSGGSFTDDTELARSDSEGRYSFYTRPGRVSMRIYNYPEGYINQDRFESGHQLNVTTEPINDVTFSLKKGVTVQVVVEDGSGRPVTGASVLNAAESFMWGTNLTTDPNGVAEFKGIDPAQPLKLSARTETAFSETVQVNPGEQQEPVKLVVRENMGARVRARLVDQKGRPLSGVKVSLVSHRQENNGRGNEGTLLSDAQGRVTSDVLWPQHGYSLNIMASDYRAAVTKPWQGVRGKTHDFGDIVLVQQNGFLAGRVVDSKGRPLSGARVWNTEIAGVDSTGEITTTDAQGRFRISRLNPGANYIFAEKTGYRLAGSRRLVPDGKVHLTIYRSTEPRPASSALVPAKPKEAALRRVAWQLLWQGLAESQSTKGADARHYRTTLVSALARTDPARAREISARAGGRYNETIALILGEKALSRSVDEAVMHFNQLPDLQQRTYLLVTNAGKLVKPQPAGAKVLLRHALVAARGITSIPYQSVMLAQIGGVMNRLQMPQGRELIRQAATRAQKFALTGWEAYARGVVAEQMCEWDLPGALALVMPIKDVETEKPRHLGNIAFRIADKAPERARQLLEVVPQSHYRDFNLARLCYRWAPTQRTRAQSALQAIRENRHKVQACLWMAERTAKTSPKQAHAYLDQAVTLAAEQAQKENHHYGTRNAATTIIAIAHQAVQIGHPGAQEMLLRAFSLRTPRRHALDLAGGDGSEGDAQLAVVLAGLAPADARRIVEAAAPASLQKSSIPNLYRGDIRSVALALLMIDPALCQRYLRQLKAARLPVPSYVMQDLVAYGLGDAKKRRQIIDRTLHMGGDPEEDN